MTRKELYYLSVKLSSGVLRDFFGVKDHEGGFENMEQNPSRAKARKRVYETLAPLLVDKETSS